MSAKTVRMLILAAVALGLFIWVMLEIETNSESTISKITEPQYIMTCGIIETKIRAFNSGLSGFRVYYMDGTSEWFSSGVPCSIKDIK